MMPCRHVSPAGPSFARRRPALVLAALLALAGAVTAAPAAATMIARDDLGVNVFGFSHHLKNPWDEQLHEFNPGLGLQWTFAHDRRGSLELNLGTYADSYGHANHHLSLGGRLHVAGPFEVGLQMINAVSLSLNDGKPVVTPYPLVAARLPMVTVDLAYIPELRSFNGLPSLATCFTFHPWRRADGHDDVSSAPAANALEFTVPTFSTLRGFDERGFMWRRLFDDRHGLRFGCRLDGTVSSGVYSDGERYGADGSYWAALLVQYLRRQAPHGRLRTYWATGVQARFRVLDGGGWSEEGWRTDLGLECALNPELSLALEYGLVLKYRYNSSYWDWDIGVPAGESVTFGSGDARLALVVGRNGRPASVGGDPSGSGPFVALGADFAVGHFADASLAWRWLETPERGWRLLATPQFAREQSDSGDALNLGLSTTLQRLYRRPGPGRLDTYWGVGPTVGFAYSELHHRASYDNATRDWRVSVDVVVGTEARIGAGLYVLAEYGAGFGWRLVEHNNPGREATWSVVGSGARLGLGATF